MIELYSGTPGSGKSLHLAEKMKNWIQIYKSPVIANFYFKADVLRIKKGGSYIYVDNQDITPAFLVWFSEYYKKCIGKDILPEETILLVLDECQLLFNARAWNDRTRPEWISFFTQHRKLGYRIILVAQFAEMIDKQIRALIEYEYIHRKVKNVGIYGKVLNILAFGNLHIAVKMYSPLRQKVGQEFFKANKGLFGLYNTYNTFAIRNDEP